MKTIKLIGLVAAILTGSVAVAVSGGSYGHGGGMSMKSMQQMDADNDDVITFDEFSAPQMKTLKSAFTMIDTNNDELIDAEEWNAFLALHGYDTGSETN